MEMFLPVAHVYVNIWLILMFGAAVGLLSGLTGVGGGFLITPLLIFSGVAPIIAVSSGAAQMAGTAAGASYLQWRNGNIDFRLALVLLLGSWVGGGIGVYLSRLLQQRGEFGNTVNLLYVLLLGFIGVTMLIESLAAMRGLASDRFAPAPLRPARGLRHLMRQLPFQLEFPVAQLRISALIPALLGAAVGMLTSLMGVGGGFIMVPVMIYLLKVPARVVAGTSIFQLLFTTAAVSVMQAGANHSVDPFLVIALVLGSIYGTKLGVMLGARMSGEKLRLALALVVVGVAVKMLGDMLIAPAGAFLVVLDLR